MLFLRNQACLIRWTACETILTLLYVLHMLTSMTVRDHLYGLKCLSQLCIHVVLHVAWLRSTPVVLGVVYLTQGTWVQILSWVFERLDLNWNLPTPDLQLPCFKVRRVIRETQSNLSPWSCVNFVTQVNDVHFITPSFDVLVCGLRIFLICTWKISKYRVHTRPSPCYYQFRYIDTSPSFVD